MADLSKWGRKLPEIYIWTQKLKNQKFLLMKFSIFQFYAFLSVFEPYLLFGAELKVDEE